MSVQKPEIRNVHVTRYVTPLREGGSMPAIAEADEEIQDLLKASVGLNLGVHYLSGSITFDPVVDTIDELLASKIVWLDTLIANVDRTARNTNMLMWQKQLWLIDHGASLYFHHSWHNWEEQAAKPFVQIKDHVLLPYANRLDEADAEMRKAITPEQIDVIVSLIPEQWLKPETPEEDTQSMKQVYRQFLINRLSGTFLNEARHAREVRI